MNAKEIERTRAALDTIVERMDLLVRARQARARAGSTEQVERAERPTEPDLPPAVVRVPACDVVTAGTTSVLDGERRVTNDELSRWMRGRTSGVAHQSTDPAALERAATLHQRAERHRLEEGPLVRALLATGVVFLVGVVMMVITNGAGTVGLCGFLCATIPIPVAVLLVIIHEATEDHSNTLHGRAAALEGGHSLVHREDRVRVPETGHAQAIARHACDLLSHGELEDAGWALEVREAVEQEAAARTILDDDDATAAERATAQRALDALAASEDAWVRRHLLAVEHREQLASAERAALEAYERHDRAVERQSLAGELEAKLAARSALDQQG